MKQRVTFFEPYEMPHTRAAIEYVFPFCAVDSSMIGEPRQKSLTTTHIIKMDITTTLLAVWRIPDKESIIKVLFQYAREDVEQKIKDGMLSDEQELSLATYNSPESCPFDISSIPTPTNYSFEVDIPIGGLSSMTEKGELELASRIIYARDNINTLFHSFYKDRLLLLREERSLLDLLRHANNEEEFVFRLSSLATMIDSMNIDALRKVTSSANKQLKSISLLELLLRQEGCERPDRVCAILRNIARFRQGYPIHGDRVDGVVEAHKFFCFSYPMSNYNEAWKTLMLNYLEALSIILQMLKSKNEERE